MKRLPYLLIVLAAVLAGALPTLLTGKTSTSPARCRPGDIAASCVLKTQPKPLSISRFAAQTPAVARGVDFAWSMPSLATFKANGWKIAAGYLSYDASKNLTPARVNALHAGGVSTVPVWETGALRAEGGWRAGFSDAREAARQLVVLRAPADQPFDMAVDCDCPGALIAPYFQGAQAAERGRVNAYGGYYQIQYLAARGLVGHFNWQTYAWSRGLWLPASIAPLEQWLNGSTFDYDRAIAPNYGQWPAATPPKPARPHCFGPLAQTKLASCQRIRATVHKQSLARTATLRAMNRNHCPYSGIVARKAAPLFHTYPVCRKLGARATFFAQRIHAELY